MKPVIQDHSLYLVISEECGKGRKTVDIAREAIAGGIDIVQMREKAKPRKELLRLGKELSLICRSKDVIFIVNDDPRLAKEIGADGVHLGQEDMQEYPVDKARSIMGEDAIIGVSTHSIKQFEEANALDIDYIAFGPIYKTKTKDYFIGADDVAEISRCAKKPVFFIGGINLSNVDELLAKGATNIAMIRAIVEAEDITAMAKEFKKRLGG